MASLAMLLPGIGYRVRLVLDSLLPIMLEGPSPNNSSGLVLLGSHNGTVSLASSAMFGTLPHMGRMGPLNGGSGEEGTKYPVSI